MANKKALLGGASIKVENMSGFDKSGFNAFTAPLGAIVPMRKQLMLPGKFKLSVKLSAQLPPLATDAFLRTHLKVEAFLVPMRLCYGGYQSWFAGEPIVSATSSTTDPFDPNTASLTRSKLCRIEVTKPSPDSDHGITTDTCTDFMNHIFGPHTLMDYFGVKWPLDSNGDANFGLWPNSVSADKTQYFNAFPFLAYQLCYHHYYRNKNIERPLFAPPSFADEAHWNYDFAAHWPYIGRASWFNAQYELHYDTDTSSVEFFKRSAHLLNGDLLQLRYRNYGYDYFTTALPSAQEGSPMSVDTSGGSFTISSLRAQNALQHFAEVNQLSSPDYVATVKARYGTDVSMGVAQKPILLGSADFPMFTSGVEQTAADTGSYQNPFTGMAARFGRAHAEGNDFVCEANVSEPSYLLVMCSVVPEANYANGIQHDMRIFTQEGCLVDLPVASLEQVGYEPIYREELADPGLNNPQYNIFGYQPRYMWHKAGGAGNEVHGLFRYNSSLASFIPQRLLGFVGHVPVPQIDTEFLKVNPDDLDNVMAVSGSLSKYGVMIDSFISLKVVEPLGESALPSLVDPAYEHGKSIYLSRGAGLE